MFVVKMCSKYINTFGAKISIGKIYNFFDAIIYNFFLATIYNFFFVSKIYNFLLLNFIIFVVIFLLRKFRKSLVLKLQQILFLKFLSKNIFGGNLVLICY